MAWRGDSDASDHSDNEEFSSFNTSTYLLIAIDCEVRMFDDMFEGKSPFKAVLSACYNRLDAQLIRGGKRGANRLAIAVVSDDKDKMTVCDFKDNLPIALKELRALCEKTDGELKKRYCRDGPLNFGEFLLNTRAKFKDLLSSDYQKYVVYISNDDDPVLGNDDKIFQAVNQAKALAEAKIKFELVTFKEEFKYERFFKELLYSCGYKFNYEYLTDTISLEDKLLSLLASRGKKAKFFMFPSNTTSYFEVVEKFYIKPLKILNNTLVRRGDLKEVKKIRNVEYNPDEYRVKFSKNDSMTLTEEEKNVFIDDGVSIGFTLIGTSSGLLEPGVHRSSPKFIQENKRAPNQLFDILWEYCSEKSRTLICTRKYRVNSAPITSELSPCIINNARSFLVLGVPFAGDIKEQHVHNPLYEQKPTEDSRLMETAENFVNALNFDYDPLQIHDTVTCRKLEYIRSELLDEPARPVADICELKMVDGPEVDRAVEDLCKLVIKAVKRKAPQKQSKRAKK